jgi:hypothetical protein
MPVSFRLSRSLAQLSGKYKRHAMGRLAWLVLTDKLTATWHSIRRHLWAGSFLTSESTYSSKRAWASGGMHPGAGITTIRTSNTVKDGREVPLLEAQMKSKIEVVANVIVIAFAVLVGSVFLKDHFSPVAPESNAVKAGDKLASVAGWDWGAHDQTLILGLRKGCHFCEDSTPFYQRLIAQQQQGGSKSPIVAVFPDTDDTVKEVLQSEGLAVHALAGVPLETLKISGTPTLLLVDRRGIVLNAWIGMLSPRQELEVMKAATEPIASSLRPPG